MSAIPPDSRLFTFFRKFYLDTGRENTYIYGSLYRPNSYDVKKEGIIMSENLNIEELKAKAETLIKSISGDKDLLASFTKDPIGTLEKKLGIDLPDEQINQLISMIKAKLGDAGTKTLLQKILGFFKG